MYTHTTNLRVRYSETDKMGVVYHSNYVEYFEVGRTECIRSLGFSYRKMEEEGIMLPVTNLEVKYRGSLKYDDEFQIITTIPELPSFKITFNYEIQHNGKRLTTATTELVFIDVEKNRPCRAPENLIRTLNPYFI